MIKIDLTTLSGWDNISPGTHEISVVAKAQGYLDSEKSTAVTFTKASASTGETWVLNDEPDSGSNLNKTAINFTSNGQSFVAIEGNTSNTGPQSLYYYTDSTSHTAVREFGTWSNDAYKTITFDTAPTGDLLTWLQANGTKQGGTVTHNLTWNTGKYYIIKVNDTVVFNQTNNINVTQPYVFNEGDVINIDNDDSVGNIIINDTTYSSISTITLTGTDIAVSGAAPSLYSFDVTINTKE